MKIGVYGGTFDPPHLGPMEAARAAAALLELDRILFVPAALPPHKDLPPEPGPAGDRLAIVRRTSRGALAKKDGVTGWYLGKLGPA